MQNPSNESVWPRSTLRFAIFVLLLAGGCVASTGGPDGEDGAGEGVFSPDEETEALAYPMPIDGEADLEQLLGYDESGLASKATVTCGPQIALRSKANGRFVSAEFGWGGDDWGMLRARATQIGPWEVFRFCTDGGGGTLIRNEIEHKYVSTELGWGGDRYGMLRARAVNPGTWERFGIWPSGHIAISSDANGRWVSAELGWGGDRYGMLRGRATDLGPWELFEVWTW